MAPGLNSCQTGTVPKNKPNRNSSVSGQPNPRLNQRSPANIFPEDHHLLGRPSRSPHVVDSDNGEPSWGINSNFSDYSKASRTSRNSRSSLMSDYNSTTQNGTGPPDRGRILAELNHIRSCIREAEELMGALQNADSPVCRQQWLRLQEMLPGLQESEKKLERLLNQMDEAEDRIDRYLQESSVSQNDSTMRCEESRRKVEALEKKKRELIELQQRAERRLAEAEAEQVALINRAQNLNSELASSGLTDTNLQLLNDRLRNIERVCNETSQVQAQLLNDQHEQPEHPEEDGENRELSDTEPDFQLVQNKIAEINAMKVQLAHLQQLIATAKVSNEPNEAGSSRRKSKPKPNQASSTLESMQKITRELEKQTQLMRGERDRLLQTRTALQAKLSAARPGTSSSLEDGEGSEDGSEAVPELVEGAEGGGESRRIDIEHETRRSEAEQQSPFLPLPLWARQRGTWNQSLPTLIPSNVEEQPIRKDPRSTQSSIRNGPALRQSRRNNLESTQQVQQMLEESAMLLIEAQKQPDEEEPANSDRMLLNTLFTQHQQLARTVAECSRLLAHQQRQINQLRNYLMQPPPQTPPPRPYPAPSDFFNAGVANQRGKYTPAANQPFGQPPLGFPSSSDADPTTSGLEPWLFEGAMSSSRHRMEEALNNQVPPGNRANNYWDNFRSYSRQNLLSTSKSNEDRSSLSTAIVPPNNQTQNPVVQVHPSIRPTGVATASTRHQQVGRSRSVEPRLRNDVTNEIPREGIPRVYATPIQFNSNCRTNLNHRSDINNEHSSSLNSNVYQEVSNFILANENRPAFLLQLFQNLQRVTTEMLRQRTLQSLNEVVAEQSESRNNQERESNLIRDSPNQTERIEQLFQNLRENQETIRRNMAETQDPTDTVLLNRVLRDLSSYFAGNLCNFGHRSSLKNPNVSNLRENIEDYERMHPPKNVYESLYDQTLQDMRRRTLDTSYHHPNQEFESGEVAWSPREYEMINHMPHSQQSTSNQWAGPSGSVAAFRDEENDLIQRILGNNADLAEADQSRNETSADSDEYSANLKNQEENNGVVVDGSCAEGDHVVDYYPALSEGGPKSSWVREGEELNRSRDEEEEITGRQLMDIAGALEHLNGAQEEEEASAAEPEADWEQENGLDHLPTRLQKAEGKKHG